MPGVLDVAPLNNEDEIAYTPSLRVSDKLKHQIRKIFIIPQPVAPRGDEWRARARVSGNAIPLRYVGCTYSELLCRKILILPSIRGSIYWGKKSKMFLRFN